MDACAEVGRDTLVKAIRSLCQQFEIELTEKQQLQNGQGKTLGRTTDGDAGKDLGSHDATRRDARLGMSYFCTGHARLGTWTISRSSTRCEPCSTGLVATCRPMPWAGWS